MRRTTATTDYLKECMGTALLELMKEKPIEKISIEEMTARADVGRSTYFRYFKTKDEVLAFKLCCMWSRFAQQSHITELRYDEPAAARLFFEFCLSIRNITDRLYAAGHQTVILDAYLQILVSKNPGKDINAYYRSSAVAYALYGIVNAWILRGYQETPEQIAAILYDIQEKMPD